MLIIHTKKEVEMWSITKIKTYTTCKRLFLKRYIEKAAPENPEPVSFIEGRDFHIRAQNILKGIEPNDLGIPDDLLQLEWQYEVKLEAEVEGTQIVGYVDAIARIDEGHVAIAEFKNYPTDPKEQLGVYSFLFSEQNAELPVVEFVSITPTFYTQRCYTPDEYLRYGARLLTTIKQIEKEMAEFPLDIPNPGSGCLYCQYRKSCPALQVNSDMELFTRDPQSLARRLLALETEIADLKEIARAFTEAGAEVSTGDVIWDYEFYEELEVNPSELFKYLASKGINPFELQIPKAKGNKSIFRVDTRIFKEYARKVDAEVSNMASVSIQKRFTRKKKEVSHESTE
jgi:CRISPR/Cas system-associated exonuclease Cas4 (RecB family)